MNSDTEAWSEHRAKMHVFMPLEDFVIIHKRTGAGPHHTKFPCSWCGFNILQPDKELHDRCLEAKQRCQPTSRLIQR